MSLSGRRGFVSGDVWLQWFSCCMNQQAGRKSHPSGQRDWPRIDRSMIGSPTNFQHVAHVGSRDLTEDSRRLNALHNQMQSKGGYDMPC